MEWHLFYDSSNQPTMKEITAYINNDLWQDLNDYLQKSYGTEPVYSYSTCPLQPGWNVKYKKSGRALCTLYPVEGYFIALVVIGNKEMNEAELLMPMCADYTKSVFEKVPFSAGGRWLMLEVTDPKILEDVKNLIKIRVKPKNQEIRAHAP